MTTKIVALADALGNLVDFGLLPGQRHDTVGVAPLIDGIDFGGLIADKAFDVNWIVEELERRGAEIVISQHPNRVAPRKIDTEVYKWRHLIENVRPALSDQWRSGPHSANSRSSSASPCEPARQTAVSPQ